MTIRALILLIPLLGLIAPAHAADPTQPHNHQGVLDPYTGAPPSIDLDDKDLAKLAKGKPVMKPFQDSETGGRGMAVQDVAATPEQVWDRIMQFEKYPEWVKYVAESEPYEQAGEHTKVRFVLKGLGFRYEYFIDHVIRTDQGYLTWTLDYTRQSDLNDSVGFWFVEAHPETEGWSRLYYSVDVQVKDSFPKFIQEIATKTGLKEATSWVKREAEALAAQ